MKLLNELKWSIFAGLAILAGLMLSRGGAASLVPLIRFVLPAILVFVVFKLVSKKVKTVATDFVTKNMTGQNPRSGTEQKIIDLCPKCGVYKTPGHKCETAKKS